MASFSQDSDPFTIGIFLHEGVEELDFCGPFEVFKSAAVMRSHQEQKPDWQVFTVAEEASVLKTSGELLVQPNYSFADHPHIDLLLLPGGMTGSQLERPQVIDWIRQVTLTTQLATSVCTGAFLLGAVGLLDGHDATTHWSALDRLAEQFPQARVRRGVRWADEGSLVTAAGISAGMDMSLHLVERLESRQLAEEVAHYMEYRWQEQ